MPKAPRGRGGGRKMWGRLVGGVDQLGKSGGWSRKTKKWGGDGYPKNGGPGGAGQV